MNIVTTKTNKLNKWEKSDWKECDYIIYHLNENIVSIKTKGKLRRMHMMYWFRFMKRRITNKFP